MRAEKRKLSVKEAAYRLLAARQRCTHELRKKLKEREFSEKEIEGVLKDLDRLGYIDDNDWLRCFIRNQARQKNGPKRIRQKLLQIGFRETDFCVLLEECCSISDERDAIKRLLSTTYRRRDLTDWKERMKVMAALQRKGFSEEAIRHMLDA